MGEIPALKSLKYKEVYQLVKEEDPRVTLTTEIERWKTKFIESWK
jgi:hypothetical protein